MIEVARRIEPIFGKEEILVFPKNQVTSNGNFVPNSGLRKFRRGHVYRRNVLST